MKNLALISEFASFFGNLLRVRIIPEDWGPGAGRLRRDRPLRRYLWKGAGNRWCEHI